MEIRHSDLSELFVPLKIATMTRGFVLRWEVEGERFLVIHNDGADERVELVADGADRFKTVFDDRGRAIVRFHVRRAARMK